MTQPCAVPELLNDIVGDCKNGDCLDNCSCLKNHQTCTFECVCRATLAVQDDCDDVCKSVCLNPKTLEYFCPDFVEEIEALDIEDFS